MVDVIINDAVLLFLIIYYSILSCHLSCFSNSFLFCRGPSEPRRCLLLQLILICSVINHNAFPNRLFPVRSHCVCGAVICCCFKQFVINRMKISSIKLRFNYIAVLKVVCVLIRFSRSIQSNALLLNSLLLIE